MYSVLITIIVIAAVLLVLIVLVQNSKGGGLANDLTGSRQFGSVAEQKSKLENYTWGLVVAIAVLSIIASVSTGNRNNAKQESGVKEIMINNNSLPTVPTLPTAPQE